MMVMIGVTPQHHLVGHNVLTIGCLVAALSMNALPTGLSTSMNVSCTFGLGGQMTCPGLDGMYQTALSHQRLDGLRVWDDRNP